MTAHPERLLNIHYFNPALVMQLTEIVRGPHTAEETIETAKAFAAGKCEFCDEAEYALLQKKYGSMRHLRTMGRDE